MRAKTRFSVLTILLIGMLMIVPVVSAHPLGNFTINHYSGLTITPNSVAIDYVLDMAEIPAFQEISTFDASHTNQPSVTDAGAYHPAQCENIRKSLNLSLNGNEASLALISSEIAFPPGAGGLPTLRLTCKFQAPTSGLTGNVKVDYKDNSYPERLGWREITMVGDGVTLKGDILTSSISQRLTNYPQDLLTSPLNQRQVTFEAAPAANSVQQPPVQPAISQLIQLAPGRSDPFTELIKLQNIDLPTLLLALLISVVWGGLHALTPGHGKTIVAAYLVGSRGTARHALFLGLITTVTHTAGVFAMGIITLLASRYFIPEQIFPWLSVISGLLVFVIGINLVISRLRSARGSQNTHLVQETPEHDASLGGHSHDGIHSHNHVKPQPSHNYGRVQANPIPIKEFSYVQALVGSDLTAHDHEHHSEHSHLPHSTDGNLVSDLTAHDHEHHSEHSHLPPGADGSPVTMRSLLALGVSGGLLPCPSALIVLLSAISLGKIGFGLVLVVAFSVGLAGVLTAIGLLLVYSRSFFNRLPINSQVMRLIPAGSALFICIIGLGITIKALTGIGLL